MSGLAAEVRVTNGGAGERPTARRPTRRHGPRHGERLGGSGDDHDRAGRCSRAHPRGELDGEHVDRPRLDRRAARPGTRRRRHRPGSNGLAALIELTVDGGSGNDTIGGGDGDDRLLGGSENDLVDGNRGDDIGLLGGGDDTFRWDPGDGSDVVEGQAGFDTLLFNGAGAAENIDISANGPRLRFFRDVASITMDVDDTEKVFFQALGGADNVVVNDLSGTDVVEVETDLAAAIGGAAGDGQPDTVTVNGTNGDDVIVSQGQNGRATVAGFAALVRIVNAEPANDRLLVKALAGNDVSIAAGLAASSIGYTADGGEGDDILIGSDGDDVLNGEAGDDIVIGGPGADQISCGPGERHRRLGCGRHGRGRLPLADRGWSSRGLRREAPASALDQCLLGVEGDAAEALRSARPARSCRACGRSGPGGTRPSCARGRAPRRPRGSSAPGRREARSGAPAASAARPPSPSAAAASPRSPAARRARCATHGSRAHLLERRQREPELLARVDPAARAAEALAEAEPRPRERPAVVRALVGGERLVEVRLEFLVRGEQAAPAGSRRPPERALRLGRGGVPIERGRRLLRPPRPDVHLDQLGPRDEARRVQAELVEALRRHASRSRAASSKRPSASERTPSE